MKRKNSFVPFGIATAALAALAAGTMLYSHNKPDGDAPPPSHPLAGPETILPDALPTPTATPNVGAAATAFVYQVATDDNGSHLKKVSVSLGASGGTSNDPAPQAALNAMASETDSPLPNGTHADAYTVSDGVATVDFNQAFVDNFKGGDEAEALTINAVLATIGQFGPHSVQITVAGKKIDSLGGTLSLTNPVPVPQASEQTAQGSSGKP